MTKVDGPKLPVKQLAILAVARFAEPLAMTSVFPYLPEMIRSFGVGKHEVAKWAGYTGAIFSVTQSMTAVPWGRASDIYGRKPIILLGLLNTMICFVIFGLSTSLVQAIIVRAIMGSGNGNVGIIRTMVAEMVTEKELQPKAFSLMPLVWSLGSIFGPAFGGFFARPSQQYPALFGDSWFFNKYPFALPNLVAFVVFLISFTTGLLFLKETLESKRHEKDWGLRLGEKLTGPFQRSKKARRPRLSFCDDEAQAPLLSLPPTLSRANARDYMSVPKTKLITTSPESPSTKEIFTSQTTINLIAYTFLALHSVAYDQALPVFLNYPTWDSGESPDGLSMRLPFQFAVGFGLTSDKIGTIFTLYGICCCLIQFLLFPWLCARFGVLNCYKAAVLIFPIIYLLTPYTALFHGAQARYLALLFLMLIKGFVVIIGFPCTTILLTNSASSLRVLGTLNGFATTFSGIGRALGPALTGSTFSWGVERGYIIAPWWLLAVIAMIGAIPAWFIVEGEGPHRSTDSDSEETETEEETLVSTEDDDSAVDDTDSSDCGNPHKNQRR